MKSTLLLPLVITQLIVNMQCSAAENQLGRLFYTPAQRTQLDRLRLHVAVDSTDTPVSRIDGEVRRSSGQDSHWINGEVHQGHLEQAQRTAIGEPISRRGNEQEKLLGDGLLQIHHPSR